MPLTAIILSGLPADKIPAAAGLSNFARVFAGAVGTSLVSTGWNDRTILHHARLAEQTSVNNPTFTGALDALQHTLGGGAPQALAFFEHSLNAQAAMLGIERYLLAVGGDLRRDHSADLGDEARQGCRCRRSGGGRALTCNGRSRRRCVPVDERPR